MANLSNINGKFVVEQTTGYVGVGTTDPNYPIEVLNASAEIALNASGGSIYRLRSDSTDSFRINKNGVGDRLVIDGSGNVQIGASSVTNLSLGSSGSDFVLSAKKDGTDPINMVFKTQASGGTLAERMRITSAGQVNMTKGSSGTVLYLDGVNDYDAETGIQLSAGRAKISGFLNTAGGTPGSSLRFYTMPDGGSVTERMRITSGGLIQASAGGGGFRVVSDAGSPSNLIEYYYSSSFHHGLEVEGDRGLRMYSSSGDSSAKLTFYTEGTERMRIDSSGNVGIGTGTGAINAKLDVRNDDGLASGLHIVADFNRAAGTDAQMILGYYANGSSVDGPCVYSANGKPLILAPGTEKLRIQNSSQSLRIKGGSVTGSNYMQFVNSAETSQGYFGYGGGSNILYIVQQVDGDIQFYSNGSTRMTINTAGDVGIGVAPEGNIVSYIKQLRIGEQTTIQGHADGVGVGSASWFSTNYIFSVGGATTITAGESMVYQAQSGRHSFHNSESTAAGAVPVLRDGFSIEPNLDLKASTKGPQTQGVGVVYAAPYPLRFNTFNGTGPKFLGVYPLRGGSQFLDIAINTTSDGIMYYAMFRGYFYGRGSRWSWTGGYTYQGSIINIQNHFVLNGNTADLTAYRGAAGSAYPLNLCFRMDSGNSGYTEGFGELYIFAHAPTLQDAFQVTAFAENNAANPGLWT